MLYCDTKKIMEINGKQLILEKGGGQKNCPVPKYH